MSFSVVGAALLAAVSSSSSLSFQPVTLAALYQDSEGYARMRTINGMFEPYESTLNVIHPDGLTTPPISICRPRRFTTG